ncbi:MAG: EamA family transporter [Pseudomonadota bacterium]
MDYLWIGVSVFAALMQAVRTAAQKTLNQTMSNIGTTYVRSLVGLPVMIVFLIGVLLFVQPGAPTFSAKFLFFAFAGGASQILATMLLIYLFKLRNFAIGSMLIKVDVVMTAFVGSIFFSETLSLPGVAALLVVTVGVLLMSVGKLGVEKLKVEGNSLIGTIFSLPTQVALGCAFFFTLSYLFLREATLQIAPGNFLWRAGWTVVTMTVMQVVCVGAYIVVKERSVFTQLWPNRRIIGFIGFTSALGSIAWFTAFAIQNASYVRAVGHIEAVFTLLISWLYFRERLTRLELAGIGITVAGVLMFRFISLD